LGKIDRKAARQKRQRRVRKKIFGTPERPRLNVFRSSKHIYVQIIDDLAGETLCAASSLDPAIVSEVDTGSNTGAAAKVGQLVARRALDKGIDRVVFDRGGYKFHGRVAAIAAAAREAGLKF